MPKKMEKALAKQARKKGYKGKRAKRYIYGTMNKKGMMPKKKEENMEEEKMDYEME